MAVIKKTNNNKCQGSCGEKGTLYTVGGNVSCTSIMGNSMEVPQKIYNGITNNSTSGYLPPNSETIYP